VGGLIKMATSGENLAGVEAEHKEQISLF